MKKVLIMGLPGSGKTTLSQQLIEILHRANYSYHWLNADKIRELHNDWDFSEDGRIRQSHRMRDLADVRTEDFVICDFVAPLEEMRTIFNPDFLIWVDTITKSVFEDTNNLFVPPAVTDLRVNSKNATYWSQVIFNIIV